GHTPRRLARHTGQARRPAHPERPVADAGAVAKAQLRLQPVAARRQCDRKGKVARSVNRSAENVSPKPPIASPPNGSEINDPPAPPGRPCYFVPSVTRFRSLERKPHRSSSALAIGRASRRSAWTIPKGTRHRDPIIRGRDVCLSEQAPRHCSTVQDHTIRAN